MVRIWVNHWFSTAYNIIRLLRENEPDFYVIGTNENTESPIRTVCDEWYQEPILEDEEYAAFCLDFCIRNKIDVFMPRRGMTAVSRNRERFAENGIRVMADDYSLVSVLNQKGAAYEAFKAARIGNVPDYELVTTAEAFKKAYTRLHKKYRWVCYKFVTDEGGKSYRLIDNHKRGYSSLMKKQTTRITLAESMAVLSEKKSFSPVMVMPYLPDEEISVDCLMTPDGLIAIPRIKDGTRIERIRYPKDILDVCHALYEKFPLQQPFNVQFKYLEGVPYLLEVNTRMSGGIQLSCAASGVNIPNIAVNQLLGNYRAWKNDCLEKDTAHVEVPVVL